jgi:hypothetical protein
VHYRFLNVFFSSVALNFSIGMAGLGGSYNLFLPFPLYLCISFTYLPICYRDVVLVGNFFLRKSEFGHLHGFIPET